MLQLFLLITIFLTSVKSWESVRNIKLNSYNETHMELNWIYKLDYKVHHFKVTLRTDDNKDSIFTYLRIENEYKKYLICAGNKYEITIETCATGTLNFYNYNCQYPKLITSDNKCKFKKIKSKGISVTFMATLVVIITVGLITIFAVIKLAFRLKSKKKESKLDKKTESVYPDVEEMKLINET